MSHEPSGGTGLPSARAERTARGWFSWVWAVPVIAACLALFLAYSTFADRGPTITITFEDGHALRDGDALQCRGVRVGVVRSVVLDESTRGVVVEAELAKEASWIAAEGARFWIARPTITLTDVRGLDTVFGPAYIGVEPPAPDAAGQRRFVGLEDEPGDTTDALAIRLIAEQRGSIARGTPILYRGIRVGSVRRVVLADDAASVWVEAAIERRYAPLVRRNSAFWVESGVGVEFGWGGLSVSAGSLRSVIEGAIGFATPDEPGAMAQAGTEFPLEPEPDDDWLEWRPSIPMIKQ